MHPCDRRLLGIEWRGAHYIDAFHSAPKIFMVVADTLVCQTGVPMVDHYLGDFIIMGPPDSEACSINLHWVLAVYVDLGVPLAMDRFEGPTQCLTFLGIEINIQAGVLRLPAYKLSLLKAEQTEWSARKSFRR